MITNTIKDVEHWSHIGVFNELVLRKPIDTPFLSYENYTPCIEANAYMHKLALDKLKASSLKTYAKQIVHLIRFIEKQPLLSHFSQLTDNTFTLFINNLTMEDTLNGEPKRSPTEVAKIGEVCIKFLCFIQDFHDLSLFIGVDKANAITVIEKRYKVSIEGSNEKKEGTTLSHPSLPTKGAIKKRHPVSVSDALKVWEYIKGQKKDISRFTDPKARRVARREQYDKRLRDMAMYTAMEMLGGRVIELHSIRYSDYETARRTGKLRIMTAKKRNDEDNVRHLPVDYTFLAQISDYTAVRKRVMKKHEVGHDFLFINLNDGQSFSERSWSTYVNSWGRKLGVKRKISPHLWRHARFTEWLKQRILTSQEINSKDDFRKNVLHTKQFMQELQQFSGHTMISSLDIYLDLAWEDLHGYTKVYNAASLSTTVDQVQRQVDYIEERLARKEITATQAMHDVKKILSAFKQDVDESIESEK